MPSPTTVTGVDFVTVFVKDYPAALKFYGETLGLEHSVDYEKIPAGEFETGSLTLQVMDAAAVGREFAPSGHPIALHVEDVAAARAKLEAEGVEFVAETIDSGVCHMAIFTDPDGNALMFHNRYAPKR
ncbi:MAG TPA: VOC family protein [Solirubrobacterales bacterium]|jgi:predicted enzyme related to lactoylglutathione lyase|nr:VOC family protein [Solirubrobacterales bacterium]